MSELNALLDSMDDFEVNPQGEQQLPEDNDIVEAAVEQPEGTETPEEADTGEATTEEAEPEADGEKAEAQDDTPDDEPSADKSPLELQLEEERRQREFWQSQYKERQSLEDKRWHQYQQELKELREQVQQKPEVEEKPPPDLSNIDPEYISAVEYVVGRKLSEFEKEKLPQRVEGLQREQEAQRQAQVQHRMESYKAQYEELVEKGTVTEELAPAMIEYYQQNVENAIQNGSNTFVYDMLEYARQKNAKPKPSATKEDKRTATDVSTSGKQPKPKDGVVIKSKEDLLDQVF